MTNICKKILQTFVCCPVDVAGKMKSLLAFKFHLKDVCRTFLTGFMTIWSARTDCSSGQAKFVDILTISFSLGIHCYLSHLVCCDWSTDEPLELCLVSTAPFEKCIAFLGQILNLAQKGF